MKKILTVSLFAIMAVGAANADIASTAYVDNKVSTGVENKADKATTLGGYGINDAYTKTQIDNTVSALATKETVNGINTRVTTAEGKITTAEGKISTAEGKITTLEGKVSAMEGGQLAIGNGAVDTAQLANNSVTEAKLATELANKINAAQTEAQVDEAIDAKMGALSDSVGLINTNITTLSGRVDTTETDIQTLKTADTNINGKIGTANMGTEATTLTGAIAEVKGIADAAQTEDEVKDLITDNAINSVATGTANGTIKVDNTDVAVKGLGSAAYTNSDAYDAKGSAAAAQTAAIDAAKTAGDAAYAVKGTETTAANNTTAINTIKENLGVLDVKIPGLPAQTGMYSLVANDGVITWEKVNPGN